MKILFLSRFQDTTQRGAETFVRELSKQLSKDNDVDVLSGKRADTLDEILKGNYQIVIAVNGGMQGLKASWGRMRKKYKLVISGQAGIGIGEIFNIVVAKPDLFVALTENMYNWAKSWAWGSKVIKIPNGVDLTKFKPNGEKINFNLKRPIVLSVGALVWYKHHEKTIKALSLLDKGSLVIVGQGEERENLESLGQKLLGDRFKIIQADYRDLPKIYRAADLFVLPSWEREAFGIVYLEAMACGLGVVAPNDSSRSEIIGEAGILVDTSNYKKYAQSIEQALSLNWKVRAINQAKKYSWENIAKKYEQAFSNL